MISDLPLLKPADFNSNKYLAIQQWKNSIESFEGNSPLNKAYLVAAACICELCVKDVVEQVYKLLLIFTKDETEESYFLGLLKRHNVDTIISELSKASDGIYSFPPIPEQINSKEMMGLLYEPLSINITKEELLNIVNKYIMCRNDFLEDYEQQRYKLRLYEDY